MMSAPYSYSMLLISYEAILLLTGRRIFPPNSYYDSNLCGTNHCHSNTD